MGTDQDGQLREEGGFLSVERQGRYRYYRLASVQVAVALEGLAGLAGPPDSAQFTRSPAAAALQRARSCYNHLAGEVGVKIAAVLEEHGFLVATVSKRLEVTGLPVRATLAP
jgi:DNA-binding transcriptional ArsR family regulator